MITNPTYQKILGKCKLIYRISKRAVALLLCCAIIGEMIPPSYGSETGVEIIKVSDYGANNMPYIYSYLHYLQAAGTIGTTGSAGYKLTGTKEADLDVYIGDYRVEGNADTNPFASDISVSLEDLHLTGDCGIIVNEVYPGANATVIMAAKGSSDVSNITVLDGATLTLKAEADLNIGTLSLGSGSKLTISVSQGANCTIDNLLGSAGEVTVTAGGGMLNLKNAEVNSLQAEGAALNIVDAGETPGRLYCGSTLQLTGGTLTGTAAAKVTAGGDINVSGTTISTLNLFGYDAAASGNKTITVSDGMIINGVTSFGAVSDCPAVVTVAGFDTVSGLVVSTMRSDFPLKFYHNSEEKNMGMTHYRAEYDKLSGENPTVVGTHSGTYSSSTVLPEFVQLGYDFKGWLMPGSEELLSDLAGKVAKIGEIILNTSIEANAVEITWDWGEFDPQPGINTDTTGLSKTWTTSAKVGDTISLPTAPHRMGYVFDGWKSPTGADLSTNITQYTVDVAHLDQNGDLNLVAQWKPNTYTLRFSFAGTAVPRESIEISFDNGATWSKLTTLNEGGIAYNASGQYISFEQHIQYDQSVGDYLKSIGNRQLPVIRDTRSDDVVQAFAGWTTLNNTYIAENSVFAYGNDGMLDNKSNDYTLQYYDQNVLHNTPFALQPNWGTMSFDLTVPQVSDWSYYVNGKEITAGTHSVTSGSEIVFQTSVTNVNAASMWELRNKLSERLYLTEKTHKDGNRYLEYTFVMPKSDVNAIYGIEAGHYLDLYESPITFDEGVLYNSLSRNGFWYNHLDDIYVPLFAKVGDNYIAMSELSSEMQVDNYFYTWNFNDFYVTSGNKATQNQLTLVNRLNVYLKECNLVATEAYKTGAVGTMLGGKQLERANAGSYTHADTGKFGNIVIDNNTHNSYAATLIVEGENTVTGIFQSSVNSLNSFATDLLIKGNGIAESVLHLGSNYGNFKTVAEKVTIKGIEDRFEYIFYSPNETLQAAKLELKGSVLDATTKCVYTALGNVYLSKASTMDLKTTYIGYWTHLEDTCYVRIREDYRGVYFGFELKGSSSAVVEGNMITTGTWYEHNQYMYSTGYLVVKGYMRAGHITMTQGTLIANTLEMDYKADITGGTIITNQLINSPKAEELDRAGYTYEKREGDSALWDQTPFPTYPSNKQEQKREFKFTGEKSRVYLFGYYETAANGDYSLSGTLNGTANPMNELLSTVLVDGKISDVHFKDGGVLSEEKLKERIESTANAYQTAGKSYECVAIGNSNEDSGVSSSIITRIEIGNKAEIYAAGNLTFFNRTEINSGAKVVCYGNVRSNRDLLIDGANVTADGLGISSALSHRDTDGTHRWQRLDIKNAQITTKQLGFDDHTRTTISVDDQSVLTPAEGENVIIIRDTRVGYAYNAEEFEGPELLYDNVRVTGVWDNGFSNMTTPEKSFAPIASKNGSNASWLLDSLNGNLVTKVQSNGVLDDVDNTVAYNREKIALYAVRDYYALKIVEGIDKLDAVQVDGTERILETSIDVQRNSSVRLVMNAASREMVEKTVVWYYDANGVLHNVACTYDASAGTVEFKMPSAAVEVFITNTMTLDLYLYPITFTGNGFAVEESTDGTLNGIRSDAIFTYKGNIRVTQSNVAEIVQVKANIGLYNSDIAQISVKKKEGYDTGETVNGMTVIDRTQGFDRTITLENIYQNRIQKTYGLYAFNGAPIDVLVSGVIRIDAIGASTSGTAVTIAGAHDNQIDETTTKEDIAAKDTLFLCSYQKQYDSNCIAAETIHISNMVLLKMQSGEMFGFSSNNASVSLDKVFLCMSSYNGPVLTKKLNTLTVTNSALLCNTQTSNAGLLFKGVGTAEFVNSEVEFTYGGAVSLSAPLGHAEKLILKNTNWNSIRRESPAGDSYREFPSGTSNTPKEVVMEGDSSIRSKYRLQLPKVTMSGNSRINVYKPEAYSSIDSFFICKDITMKDNAEISADYVVISGFVEDAVGEYSTYPTFLEWMKEGKYLVKNGKLEIQGGTVRAKKGVGGACNAEINIYNGTVEAREIGTLSKLYGYTAVIPKAGEEFVYGYELAASELSSEVNIYDGIVKVTQGGYLGGQNSKIYMEDGQVTLAENATVGLTAAQQIDAENDASANGENPADKIKVGFKMIGGVLEGESAAVSVPYGSIDISGKESAVKLKNMKAEQGTITIKDSQGHYAVPEEEHWEKPTVGVYVKDTMAAMSTYISDQAYVYAGMARVDIPAGKTGQLSIASNASDTRLYVNSFGAYGAGATDASLDVNESAQSGNKNLYSAIKRVQILYDLCVPTGDPAYNHPDNPDEYVRGEAADPIQAPSRKGYTFEGWYLDREYEDKLLSDTLDTTNGEQVILYAKWAPRKIPVDVYVDSSIDETLTPENLVMEVGNAYELVDGTADKYKYKGEISATYGENIRDVNNIRISDLDLKTYTVTAIAIDMPGYTGQPEIPTGRKFDVSLLDFVDANGGRLIIRLSHVDKRATDIRFELNNKANGLPLGAQFTIDEITDYGDPTYRSSQVFYDTLLKSGKGFMQNGKLFEAVADGYEFKGWNSDKNAEEGILNLAETKVTVDTPTTYYAIWRPQEYDIKFYAEGGKISETQPTDADWEGLSDTFLKENCVYDQAIGELPTAWKKGHYFEGWEMVVKDTNGNVLRRQTVKAGDILCKTKFSELDVALGDQEKVAAMELTAKFREIQVEYRLNGGYWKAGGNAAVTTAPTWNTPLRGYADVSDLTKYTEPSNDFSILAKDRDDTGFGVVATSASYFAGTSGTDRNEYAGDYRKDLYRKGYTFAGWYESAAEAQTASALHFDTNAGTVTPVGTIPDFMNPDEPYKVCKLYAAWQPNVYLLNLHALDQAAQTAGTKYQYTTFNYSYATTGNSVPQAKVTVDVPVDGHDNQATADVWTVEWPILHDETSWYAYDKGADPNVSENRRSLMGFTFAALDPGSRTGASADAQNLYKTYAGQVTNLINQGVLFQEGQNKFVIPENYTYGDVNNIADYPNGSVIDMYAVYRERSLVFMEHYYDADGLKQREMKAEPYTIYSNYPYGGEYDAREAELNAAGYRLLGWYFLEPTAGEGNRYPNDETSYLNNIQHWKDAAEAKGSYDIKVYTVYSAQKVFTDKRLTADGSPTNFGYTSMATIDIPYSMQPGTLNYTVNNTAGLTLVKKDNLQYYSVSEGDRNKTAAIRWELYNTEGTFVKAGDLLSGGTVSMDTAVAPGWQIRLYLYTSHLVSETQEYNLDVTFGFNGTSLAQQWISLNPLKIHMIPTRYTVHYNANLPADVDPQITPPTGVAYDAENKYVDTTAYYGSDLLGEIHTVEGYEVKDGSWVRTDASGNALVETRPIENGVLDVAINETHGKDIYFKANWEIQSCRLKVDANVMQHWTVQWTPQGGSTTTYSNTAALNTTIPYHSTVKFIPRTANEIDEFVELDTGNGNITTLDKYAANAYTMLMGIDGIEAKYKDMRDLYLRKGTINISEGSYTQDGITTTPVKWRGGYNIWMDADNNNETPTSNVLNLNGNLSGRTINLGDLYIENSELDSISLSAGTTAELTLEYTKNGITNASEVIADNIQVPQGASLNVSSAAGKTGELVLTPDAQSVALGSTNGEKVSLNDVNVEMTLPIMSTNSGIEAKYIEVNNSTITVTQNANANGHYMGTWIGGSNTAEVKIDKSNIYQGEDSQNHSSSHAIIAQDVKIQNNSKLGEALNGLRVPIRSGDNISIENSEVYQYINTDVASVPLTAEDDINVMNSYVRVLVDGGSWEKKADGVLYKGVMKIQDMDSHVEIAETLILEMQNGDVEISETSTVQKKAGSTKTHNFQGSYLLLEERLLSTELPKLTVNGIQGEITVAKPTGKDTFYLSQADVKADTEMYVTAATNFKIDTLNVNNKELRIDCEKLRGTSLEESNVILDTVTASGTASAYVQNGGKLSSAAGVDCGSLDITLNRVTADTKDLIGKNLTLTGSTVNSPAGKVGSAGLENGVTHVTITDTSVDAQTIGALGEQDTTFTFVTTEGTTNLNQATVVQDHYRIRYAIEAGETAPAYAVFRTQQAPGGVLEPLVKNAAEMKAPGVPRDLVRDGFEVWYVDMGEEAYAVSGTAVSGYEEHGPLTKDLLQYAQNSELVGGAADGTQTLTLMVGLDIELSISAEKGRLFEAFSGSDTVTTPADNSWTVNISMEGRRMENMKLMAAFGKELPAGTDLTLTWLTPDAGCAKFYAYTVPAATDTVSFQDFEAMGTSTTFCLVESGYKLDQFLLAVDYTDAYDAAGGTIGWEGANAGFTFTVRKEDDAKLAEISTIKYTVTETVTDGTIELNGSTLTYKYPDNEKYTNKVKAVLAIMNSNADAAYIPYLEDAKLGNAKGLILGGNRILFVVEDSEAGSSEITGIDPNDYDWDLVLLEDARQHNVWKNLTR